MGGGASTGGGDGAGRGLAALGTQWNAGRRRGWGSRTASAIATRPRSSNQRSSLAALFRKLHGPRRLKAKGFSLKEKKKKPPSSCPAPTPLSVGPKVRGVGWESLAGPCRRFLRPSRLAAPPDACCRARWAEAPAGRAQFFRRRPPSLHHGCRLPAGSLQHRRAGRSCRRSRAVLRHRHGSPSWQPSASEESGWGAGPAPRGGRVHVGITE